LEYRQEAHRIAHKARICWLEVVPEPRKRVQRFSLAVALVVAAAGVIAPLKREATAVAAIIGSGVASSVAAMLLS
jgi:hypothetical protein